MGAAYGDNYERLVTVKNKYDPSNLSASTRISARRCERAVVRGMSAPPVPDRLDPVTIESISAVTLATHDMARALRFYRALGFP